MTEEKIIKCKKCFKVIGRTAFDSQVLILENGLVAFNYLCWLCPFCKKSYDSWIAPDLDAPEKSNAEQSPDLVMIQQKSVKIRKSFKASQPKPEKPPKVQKSKRQVKGYHFDSAKNKFRAVITIKGKPIYLGIFDNETDAHNAYLTALAAKNMHNLQQDIPADNSANHG